MGIKISDIVIGERFRKDYGDIENLQESIKTIGLLHSIVIQRGTNKLIAGARRLKALENLGYQEIPDKYIKWVDNIDTIIKAEFDENYCRKDLTPVEGYAIWEALKEEVKKTVNEGKKKKLSEIKKKTSKNDDNNNFLPEETDTQVGKNFPHLENESKDKDENKKRDWHAHEQSKTMTKVAKMIGMSRPTLKKVQEIVETAKSAPERFGKYLEELETPPDPDNPDKKVSVDAIYKKLIEEKRKIEQKQYNPSEALLKLSSDPEKKLLNCIYSTMCNLPEGKQTELISKYGHIMPLVQQSIFDRGIKYYTQNKDINETYEETIYKALEDIFVTTQKKLKKWVFMDQCGSVANINISIVQAQGSDITDWDKAEAFLINMAMSGKLLMTYLTKLIRSNELDASTDTRTNEDAIKYLESIKQGMQSALEIAKDVCIRRLAKKIKETITDVPNDDIRSQINAMEMSSFLTDAEEEIEHLLKKIDNAIKKISNE